MSRDESHNRTGRDEEQPMLKLFWNRFKDLAAIHVVTALVGSIIYTSYNRVFSGTTVFVDPVMDYGASMLFFTAYIWPVSITIAVLVWWRSGRIGVPGWLPGVKANE